LSMVQLGQRFSNVNVHSVGHIPLMLSPKSVGT